MYMIQDNMIEYVRRGMLEEAAFLFKYDFENSLTDLNRLYGGALSGDLPTPIVKISVVKMSHIHR